ncbi:MAG: T9SS type A sorting domain-containing protein [Paludibacteraceae bacterium]|nr:T9SS type A sorting domain-containing protein [Paludibacteraceae bacterium]
MNRLLLIFSIIIATLSLQSHAQISFGGLPTSTMQTRSSVSFPSISISPDTTMEIASNQFAYPNEVSIDLTKEASASICEDKIIYRLLIYSDNAKSINLIFNPITLPSNAKMFLSRPDGREIYGAYTNESFSGNVFATTPVSGDSVMIQCEVPITTADSFSATIESVNVGFEELRLLPAHNKASYCEMDVVCQDDGVEDQCRAACLIIVNGNQFCTGTLVATDGEDSDAFVLTSAHCLRDYTKQFDSTLARKSIFYFGYNSSLCETRIIGSYEKSISGSQVVSSNAGKDMLLLKLSKRPPVDYMTYESGWNIESNPYGPVTCIHHPSGDLMKISIGDNDPQPYSFPVDGLDPDSHWLVSDWAIGVTERGSSGAPLYDRNGLIIGALSGGASLCSKRGNDKFWRLNNVWNNPQSQPTDIMSVLDPSRYGIIRLNGRESYERRCSSLKNYSKFSEVIEPFVKDYGYASGTNSVGLEEFAEKFTSEYSSTEIHGVSFTPILGTYDVNKPVFLRIYTGEDKPETLVYESIVKVSASEYIMGVGGTSNTPVDNWSYKENYIRLDSVVTVGNTFFVSFHTDYENVEFALLAASSDTKTAYFKQNGAWESYESHPFDNNVGCLLINATVRDANGSGIKNIKNDDTEDDNYITVYPNPARNQIHIKCPDEIREVKVFNSTGKLESDVHELNIKGLPNGIYSLEISTSKGKYHTKFIKE